MGRGAVERDSRADWLRNAAGVVDIAYWRGTVNWYWERSDVASAVSRVSFVAHSQVAARARVRFASPLLSRSRGGRSPARLVAGAAASLGSSRLARRFAHPRSESPASWTKRHPHVC